MTKSILFVDDEVELLDSLQRSLKKHTGEWTMAFVKSGQEAVERLKKEAFDVAVIDLAMPVMSGQLLIAHVREHYPNTVRIVFTGTADRALAQRLAATTHGYVVKPCDPDMLMSVINVRYAIAAHNQRGEVAAAAARGSAPAPVNVNEILKRAVASTRQEWSDVAQIEADFDPRVPEIPLQAARATTLFVNMIVNAAQAIADKTPDGGRIWVATRQRDDGCEVRIKDTASQIPKHIAELGAKATAQDYLDAALPWLAVAHDTVVRQHGGTFFCETDALLGTSYVIYFKGK